MISKILQSPIVLTGLVQSDIWMITCRLLTWTQILKGPHTVNGRILHHLGWIKPRKSMGYLPYQLVQDFFHQQYDLSLRNRPPEVWARIKRGFHGRYPGQVCWNHSVFRRGKGGWIKDVSSQSRLYNWHPYVSPDILGEPLLAEMLSRRPEHQRIKWGISDFPSNKRKSTKKTEAFPVLRGVKKMVKIHFHWLYLATRFFGGRVSSPRKFFSGKQKKLP